MRPSVASRVLTQTPVPLIFLFLMFIDIMEFWIGKNGPLVASRSLSGGVGEFLAVV